MNKKLVFFNRVLEGPGKFREFLTESNRIEGITRCITDNEYSATREFLDLETLTIKDICKLVDVFEPGAKLRNKLGMNVRIGDHVPPSGNHHMDGWLDRILESIIEENSIWTPYTTHQKFEFLHPFTDGNGRSGRMIWLWQMGKQGNLDYALKMGFLHAWYYQSLSEGR